MEIKSLKLSVAHGFDSTHVQSTKSYNNINVGSFDSSPLVVSSPALYLVIISSAAHLPLSIIGLIYKNNIIIYLKKQILSKMVRMHKHYLNGKQCCISILYRIPV